MKTIQRLTSLALPLLLCGLPARAQAPLAKPLADFDKLVSQLKITSVVGEPIRVGDTAVIPFAAIKFGLGGGEAMIGFGGGMGGQTIPLGVLIVEGDDVRMERFPDSEEKPSILQELIQAVRDRKVVIMGNGVNFGDATGSLQDLAPVIPQMLGQTTFMGNALNVGHLKAPAPAASPTKSAATAGIDLDRSIANLKAAIAAKPTAEAYYHLGEALQKKGQRDQAIAAYKKALELKPDYPEASKALAAIQ